MIAERAAGPWRGRPDPIRPALAAAMLPSQAGAGNGAAAALARGSGLGRSPVPVPRGANGGGAAAGPPGGRLEREALYSGSEGDSDSAEEEELGSERRGVKRGLAEAAAAAGPAAGAAAAAYSGGGGGGAVSGAKPGKKTRGRVKIKMEFIDNKLRRYTTFSKRKTGIMKKVRPRGGERPRGGALEVVDWHPPVRGRRPGASPGPRAVRGRAERGAGRRGCARKRRRLLGPAGGGGPAPASSGGLRGSLQRGRVPPAAGPWRPRDSGQGPG